MSSCSFGLALFLWHSALALTVFKLLVKLDFRASLLSSWLKGLGRGM